MSWLSSLPAVDAALPFPAWMMQNTLSHGKRLQVVGNPESTTEPVSPTKQRLRNSAQRRHAALSKAQLIRGTRLFPPECIAHLDGPAEREAACFK